MLSVTTEISRRYVRCCTMTMKTAKVSVSGKRLYCAYQPHDHSLRKANITVIRIATENRLSAKSYKRLRGDDRDKITHTVTALVLTA